ILLLASPPPPTPPLFPSTTLFRSYAVSGASANATTHASMPRHSQTAAATPVHVRGKSSIAASTLMLASASSAPLAIPVASIKVRSEEHTSELQSRVDLVCRLLLEK